MGQLQIEVQNYVVLRDALKAEVADIDEETLEHTLEGLSDGTGGDQPTRFISRSSREFSMQSSKSQGVESGKEQLARNAQNCNRIQAVQRPGPGARC